MDASVRDQILDWVLEQLNTDRPTGVPTFERSRGLYLDDAALPSGIVYPVRDTVLDAGENGGPPRGFGRAPGPLLKRRLRFAVEIRVGVSADPTHTVPPDKAADEICSWCESKLNGQEDDNGLFVLMIMATVGWEIARGTKTYLAALCDFDVDYTTRVTDATKAA